VFTRGALKLVRLSAISLPLLASVACMFTPHDGAVVDDTQPIAFDGLVTTPNALVTLKGSTSATGTFSTWEGSTARSSSSVAVNWSDTDFYAWSVSTRVPSQFWSDGTDSFGCAQRASFIRASSGSFGMYTSNRPALETQVCLLEHNGDTLGAVRECLVAETAGVARIIDTVTYTGDVVIRTAADILSYRCYDRIDGSLTINVPQSEAAVVSLPRLSRVTGDVTLIYDGRRAPTGPSGPLPRRMCGRDTVAHVDFTRFDLPQLKELPRDLTLVQPGTVPRHPGSGFDFVVYFDVGLHQLQRVGRTLSFETHQFEGSACGLSALSAVTNVTLRLSEPGIGGPDGLMRSLASIGGTLDLNAVSVSGTQPLAALATVGDLLITSFPRLAGHSYQLPALTRVRRAARFVSAIAGSTPIALANLGTLNVASSDLSLEDVGRVPLRLAGLVYTDNSATRILSSTGTTKITLEPTAAVQFARNAALPASQLCTFLRLQRDRGWRGTADLGGITCP
jgi:hypothetical protein